MKLLPVPATQVPLALYSQVAPASRPVTLTVPTLVMPSAALAPVSLARASVGAAAELSTVIAAADLVATLTKR